LIDSRDYLYVGVAPFEEPCAQIGDEDFDERNIAECGAYIEEIRNHYGCEPDGAELSILAHHHEFGTYREVVCYYWPYDSEAADYAYKIQDGVEYWTSVGIKTVGKFLNFEDRRFI